MPKEKTDKEENDFLVVSELPKTSVRIVESDDEKKYNLITTEEALKEILESIREIKRGTIG